VNYDPDESDPKGYALHRFSYSRELKLSAVEWACNTYVKGKKDGDLDVLITRYAAAKRLGITSTMLRNWTRNKLCIANQKRGSRRRRNSTIRGKEHRMEQALFEEFKEARKVGKAVGALWFRRYAKALYRQQYPQRVTQDPTSGRLLYANFKFSNGWFQGYRRRWRISNRCRTKTSQKPPEDFHEKVTAWLQFNRRQTVIIKGLSDLGLPRGEEVPLVGRFKLSEISNMDQTPLAFDFLSSRTYEEKGAPTVWLKESRSGWDKRQCTLQVCVSADGVPRCQPLLIFHGAAGLGDCRRREEMRKYAHGVDVLWNPKAYANEDTMLHWIKHIYRFSSAYSTLGVEQEPRLLSLDAFSAHLTPAVLRVLKANRTTVSVVPGGCTGMVQVLDVSLNKPLKDLIKQEQDDHYDRNIEEWQQEKYNIGERRILLTHWVAKAWKRLHLEYKDTIVQTFRNVGLALNPDGSEDIELKIKGIPDISVGDFAREDGLNQKEDGEEALALVLAEAAYEEEIALYGEELAFAEGDKDEEDIDLSVGCTYATDTLSRLPSQRTKRLPARDRYFLFAEAEEGDPACYEDPEDATIENEDPGDEGWDDEGSDNEFDPDEEAEDYEMVQEDHNML
jgi:hypothetical protein